MTSESKGTFRVEEWNEELISEVTDGPTIKRAKVLKRYSGEIEGEGVVSYLFLYNTPEQADIHGFERFTGTVDGKRGTFVLEHKGEFINGKADIMQTIVSKSGTEELRGIEGHIRFEAGMAEEYPIVLKHHLNKEFHLWKKLNQKSG